MSQMWLELCLRVDHLMDPRMIVFVDPKLWTYLMLKKDLNPESLKWFFLLQQFEFEVRYKG